MSRPQWAPDDIDLSRPNAARIYDYFLGGSHNFTVDRELGDKVLAVIPGGASQAVANRRFLRRAVTYCVEAGIRQFLDIGSGIPTVGNVHEVAGRLAPESRVVYVDMDPVAVLMVAVLHVIPDEDQPSKILARLRDTMAPGSHLVVAHGTDEGDPAQAQRVLAMSAQTNTPMRFRSRVGVRALFDGFDIVEPGVVWASQWRPDPDDPADPHPELSNNYAAVGRKP
jgi:hypothetical protein